MDESVILYELTPEGVAVLTFNRPESLNAFNDDSRIRFLSLLGEISENQEVKAVVITGAGKAFSSGADVKGLGGPRTSLEARDKMKKYLQACVTKMLEMEKPIITAVNGHAAGAGCNIALAGDIIIASEKAKFTEVFVRIGLIPDTAGMYLLPKMIGIHKAKELAMRGLTIDGTEAERIGLVNYVVPHEELMEKAMSIAKELAAGPTRAIGLTKIMMNACSQMDLATSLNYEGLVQATLVATEDHKESVRAFGEKRKPVFTGK